jgi:excisionase family DNA binding protein
MEQRLISIKELGVYLNISPQTIRNKLSSGTFPIIPIKLGGKVLFDIQEIEKFLDKAKKHLRWKNSNI